MPNLVDNWTVDRSPGQGKTLLVSGLRVGIGGLTGIGQPSGGGSSTPPSSPFPLLMPPGTPIPLRGSPDRAKFFAAFKSAVGFNGQTALHGWPATADATSISISAWINYGVNTIVGFNPNPLQGVLYGANFQNVGLGGNPSYIGIGPGGSNAGSPIIGASTVQSSNIAAAPIIGWPGDGTTGAGWVHYMFSFQSGFSKDRYLIWLNDTLYADIFTAQNFGNYKLSFGTPSSGPTIYQFIGGDGGSESNTMTDGLYAAVAELWVAQGHFVNWNDQATRYRFHTSDILEVPQTWAPVNLGNAGQAALGFKPTLYCSGGPSEFIFNRANGLAPLSVLLANLSTGLVLVDDPPT